MYQVTLIWPRFTETTTAHCLSQVQSIVESGGRTLGYNEHRPHTKPTYFRIKGKSGPRRAKQRFSED